MKLEKTKPVRMARAVEVNDSGELVCAQEQPKIAPDDPEGDDGCTKASSFALPGLTVHAFTPGEWTEMALISADGAVKAFARATPFPIEGRDGQCHVWMEPIAREARALSLHGGGFTPREKLTAKSRSNGEVLPGEITVEEDGSFGRRGTLDLLLPGVAGKRGGNATYTVEGKSCKVVVNYHWGNKVKVQ